MANETYHEIVTGMHKRKILRLNANLKTLRFQKEELQFIDLASKKMAKTLGFADLKELNSKTGDPYISLKILLSLYRRLRTLADYQNKGKVDFPELE